jgi:hypothetical protein
MRTIRIIAVIVFLVFLVPLISCRQQQAANVNVNTLKIKVSAAGEISIDGQVASMDQTSAMLVDSSLTQSRLCRTMRCC